MTASLKNPAGDWLPVFVRLADQPVLVVGGGETARRKVDRLLKHGAKIDLAADSLNETLHRYHDGRRLNRLEHGLPEVDHGYRLVVISAEAGELKQPALEFASRFGLMVNTVDDPDNCSAILPAIVDRAPITIAIGSGGTAPELARMIRSRIETLLPETLGPLAQLSSDLKHRIRQRFPSPPRRRRFLDWIFNGPPAAALSRDDAVQAESLIERQLECGDVPAMGSVALVGAGPGDPELLTLKALRLIQAADVIVHDGLVDERILEYARRDAEFIDVAKRRGRCSTPQTTIHELLVVHARAGNRVVRLKGGDPMIFGRGGEELEVLRSHGIEYQVVPGITAASACASYAGIPLTHRDHAQSVRMVTAHCKASIDRLDWQALAEDRQTLAFFMAVGKLETVRDKLVEHGRCRSTPVAIVENGTRPEQRVLRGELGRLDELARAHDVVSPAMVYVGEVTALADSLGWYGSLPLQMDTGPEKRAATA